MGRMVCRPGVGAPSALHSASLSGVTDPAPTPVVEPRFNGRVIRAGYRTAIAAFVAALVLVPAFPAAAGDNIGNIGEVRNPDSLSLPLELLIFIGIPIVAFIIAGLLAYLPGKGSSQRYRPGRPWTHDPVWFGDESALEQEPKRAALPGAGGASGRW